MDAEAAKLIGAGLAAADSQQGRLFIGFAAAELLGLLAFVVAMILIFVA
jgi:F-type H+-transporting ATPase subunit c